MVVAAVGRKVEELCVYLGENHWGKLNLVLGSTVIGGGAYIMAGGVSNPTNCRGTEVYRWIGVAGAACYTAWAAYKCIQFAKEYFSDS